MNRIMKKTQIVIARHTALWSQVSRGAFATLAVAALIFAATGANASCANLMGSSSGPVKLPMLAQAGTDLGGPSSDSIVGLWNVIYTMLPPGGPPTLMNVSLKEWHSDGTEFENAYLSPTGGNLCLGVWKTVAPRTVRVHHLGWIFAQPGATATAFFTQDETDTVSRDGKTYTGTFKFQMFDITGGTQGPEVNGTIAATRITVD